MKILIIQPIKVKGDNFPYTIKKEYDSTVIPSIGMEIEDILWKDPGEYLVTGVTINYCDNTCYVYVKEYKHEILVERKEAFEEIANTHGWTCVW